MDEFDLINRCFASRATSRPDVELGIGDDGAVVSVPGGKASVVVVTDTIVAGVHFPPEIPPACIGHRALAVNLSDIAAMGGEPTWAVLALTLPDASAEWLDAFAAGLLELASLHDVALVGGDTTRGASLTVTVTVGGLVPPGRALRRAGAVAGDIVCVSGTPGDAAAGLRVLQHGRPPQATDSVEAWLVHRFLRPAPRVSAGMQLRAHASAAIDLSDGLLADAHKLAVASAVRIELDAGLLPCSPALLSFARSREQAEVLALTGGDDYELLTTLSPEVAAHLDWLSEQCGVVLTAIGRVVAPAAGEAPGAAVTRDGRALELDTGGYRHFR